VRLLRSWRLGVAALGIVGASIAGVVGVGALQGSTSLTEATLTPPGQSLSPVPLAPPSTLPSTTTTVPGPSTTIDTRPKITLPVPDDLPADAYAPTAERVVGSISIPAIALYENLHTGMTLTAINRGPSWWPGTALPGQLGNSVIGGHRTTFSHPFRDLDKLSPGDRAVFTTDQGAFSYVVTSTQIVEPSAVDIADQTLDYTATLFACHPPGSARYRIIVKLQMVDQGGAVVPGPSGVAVANHADTIHYRS
jgi:sortase A